MLEKIKNNISVIASFILIASSIRLIAYYMMFGIDITSYIELGEIVSLLMDYILFSVAYLICLMILAVASMKPMMEKRYDNVEPNKRLRLNRFYLNFRRYEWAFDIGYVLLAVIPAIIGIWIGSFMIIIYLYFVDFVVTLIYAGVKILTRYRKLGSTYFKSNLRNNVILSGILLVMLALDFVTAIKDSYELIYEKYVRKVTIEYHEKLIRTSKNYIYVGRTKNYMFFYNRQTGFSHVYPNADIKRVYIRKEDRYYDDKAESSRYTIRIGGK